MKLTGRLDNVTRDQVHLVIMRLLAAFFYPPATRTPTRRRTRARQTRR